MKAQFKYSFLAGMHIRIPVYCIAIALILVFGVLGAIGVLPKAALITAVSLGGVAIAAVFTACVVGDAIVIQRMVHTPGAYLHALTPAPRRTILFTSLIAMFVMDFVSMATVSFGEVWLAFNLSDESAWLTFWQSLDLQWKHVVPAFLNFVYGMSGYMLFMLIILFGISVGKSVFYKKTASALLSVAAGCLCLYVINVLQIVLMPFGIVERFGIFYTINLSGAAVMIPLALLAAAEAAALFFINANLLERKINI